MTIFIAHERFTSKISRLTPKFREIELISSRCSASSRKLSVLSEGISRYLFLYQLTHMRFSY